MKDDHAFHLALHTFKGEVWNFYSTSITKWNGKNTCFTENLLHLLLLHA